MRHLVLSQSLVGISEVILLCNGHALGVYRCHALQRLPAAQFACLLTLSPLPPPHFYLQDFDNETVKDAVACYPSVHMQRLLTQSTLENLKASNDEPEVPDEEADIEALKDKQSASGSQRWPRGKPCLSAPHDSPIVMPFSLLLLPRAATAKENYHRLRCIVQLVATNCIDPACLAPLLRFFSKKVRRGAGERA